jgi:hypothetical protein
LDVDQERMTRMNALQMERARNGGETEDERETRIEKEGRRQMAREGGRPRSEILEGYLEGLAAPSHEREEDESTNPDASEGFHVVQRYIQNPLLLPSTATTGPTKFTLTVPVLVTSLEPIRFLAHRGEARVNFACAPYKPTGGEEKMEDHESLRRHYTKCGEVRAISKSDEKTFGTTFWEEVEAAITETVLAGLPDLKEDQRYAKDLFIHTGTRPSGSGGSVSDAEARLLAGKFANNVRKQRRKEGETSEIVSEDFLAADAAAINGGGFHLLNFEFLLDEDKKPWLLDMGAWGAPGGGGELCAGLTLRQTRSLRRTRSSCAPASCGGRKWAAPAGGWGRSSPRTCSKRPAGGRRRDRTRERRERTRQK